MPRITGSAGGAPEVTDATDRRRYLTGETAAVAAVCGLLGGAALPALSGLVGGPGAGRAWPDLVVLGLAVGVTLAVVDVALVLLVLGLPLRRVGGRLRRLARTVRTVTRTDWQPGDLGGHRLRTMTGGVLGDVAEAVDELITALEAEHTYRSIVDASGDLVILIDPAARISFVSASVRQILGYPAEAVVGQPLGRYVHTGDVEVLLDLLEAEPEVARAAAADLLPVATGHPEAGGPASDPEDDDPADGDPAAGDPATADPVADPIADPIAAPVLPVEPAGLHRPRLRVRAADGSWRRLECVVSVRRGSGLGAVLLTGRDVTGQVALEEQLLHQATHDSLTGLPNRTSLLQATARLLNEAAEDRPVGVIMIDLDRFKVINDSLGHAYGDALLAEVGPRLRSVLRPGDLIARLGGDEFAVLLPGVDEHGARQVADRLRGQLEHPFVVEGLELYVDASVGIAVSHGPRRAHGTDVETLLRESDIAMYRAKESRTGVAVYDPTRDAHDASRLELSAQLRLGVTNGEMVLHYQPVVDVVRGTVEAVEALVRWQHPELGLVPPGMFLPLAEETGLVLPISLATLDIAVAQAAAWARSGRPLTVALNLSPSWLEHADVPKDVAAALARHGTPAELLRLEITEGVLLVDPEETLPRLQALRDMGCALSLDDFGTGYSSMTHLRTLPVDQLKVDRAFVAAMTTSDRDAVIVRAAIELGHNLGMSVVAEGVEDADTLAEVVGSGCGLAQGYYFSPALPPEQLVEWIDARFPQHAAADLTGLAG